MAAYRVVHPSANVVVEESSKFPEKRKPNSSSSCHAYSCSRVLTTSVRRTSRSTKIFDVSLCAAGDSVDPTYIYIYIYIRSTTHTGSQLFGYLSRLQKWSGCSLMRLVVWSAVVRHTGGLQIVEIERIDELPRRITYTLV